MRSCMVRWWSCLCQRVKRGSRWQTRMPVGPPAMRSRTNIAPPLRPDFRRSISRTTASLPSQPSGRPLRRRWPMRHPHPLRLGYESRASADRLTLAGFKTMMREQYFVLLIDEPGSLGQFRHSCRRTWTSAERPSRPCASCWCRRALEAGGSRLPRSCGRAVQPRQGGIRQQPSPRTGKQERSRSQRILIEAEGASQ